MKFSDALQSSSLTVISRLPFWCIYLFSDVAAWLLMYVIRYREKLVYKNISLAFPEKSHREVRQTMHHFYRNFTDVLLEVIKLQTMSMAMLKRRMQLTNPEVLKKLDGQGRSVVLASGHFANWEWLGVRVKPETNHKGAAIYKQIHSKFYNDFLLEARNAFQETLMIEHEKTSRTLIRLRKEKLLLMVLSDQRPPVNELKYWIPFLGQQTPVLPGVEKIAVAFDFDVVYFDICRIKRGYYQTTFIPLKLDGENKEELELTKLYFAELEKSVLRQPECYLWSHNRWKYTKEV